MKLYCCLLNALLSCLICGIYAKYDDNLHGPLIEPQTDEPETTMETTTTKEPATTTEETGTTIQEPVTINHQIESIKCEAGTMIEKPTTEESEITDTTTSVTTTTDATTTDTTTTDTTTTDTTTTDATTTDATTTDTTSTTKTVSPNNNPCTPDPVPENLPIHPPLYRKSSDCSYLKSGTILVDAHHCRRYYVCNANRAIRLRCLTNEWYDRQKLKCRHRSLVRNCPPNRN